MSRLTRNHIRNLIREEIEGLENDALSNPDMSEPDPERDRHDAWAGGDNLHLDIDHPHAAGSEKTTQSQEVMQIVDESSLRKLVLDILTEIDS